MIYIEVGKDNIITKMHRHPFDPKIGLQQTREELEKTGCFVEVIPEPEMVIGKRPIMKYDTDTKKVYFEYENKPLSDTERVNNIESLLNDVILNKKL